jgi:hypothetical protein
MVERKVWTFFYGSYMNFDVLKELGLVPDRWDVAKLSGFDLRIEPRANLVPSDQHCVYGIIATATHQELSRLYAHAKDVLGETYLPEAVLVQTPNGTWLPALCYIAATMQPGPAADDYINRIAGPAREYGFPDWYVRRIESFRRLALRRGRPLPRRRVGGPSNSCQLATSDVLTNSVSSRASSSICCKAATMRESGRPRKRSPTRRTIRLASFSAPLAKPSSKIA